MAVLAPTAVASSDGAPSAVSVAKPKWQASRDYYYNALPPANSPAMPDLRVSQAKDFAKKAAEDAKAHLGYPPAARTLARREALAGKTDKSPRAVAKKVDRMPNVQHARLL